MDATPFLHRATDVIRPSPAAQLDVNRYWLPRQNGSPVSLRIINAIADIGHYVFSTRAWSLRFPYFHAARRRPTVWSPLFFRIPIGLFAGFVIDYRYRHFITRLIGHWPLASPSGWLTPANRLPSHSSVFISSMPGFARHVSSPLLIRSFQLGLDCRINWL